MAKITPLNRLVLRQHQNNKICIFHGHARDILEDSDLEKFVKLINRGVDDGLLERWSDPDLTPERLDAKKHKDCCIGLKLTTAGERRAEKLNRASARHLSSSGAQLKG